MTAADPNGDLVRLALLLEQSASELRALAETLTPDEAEVYCVQLEKASITFGEALALAESLLMVWTRHKAPAARG